MAAMLQVSVALTTASVKGVRSTAATHSQYIQIKTKKMMRLKGMRKEMMKMVKAIEWDCVVFVKYMCMCVCILYSYFTGCTVLVYSYCVCLCACCIKFCLLLYIVLVGLCVCACCI